MTRRRAPSDRSRDRGQALVEFVPHPAGLPDDPDGDARVRLGLRPPDRDGLRRPRRRPGRRDPRQRRVLPGHGRPDDPGRGPARPDRPDPGREHHLDRDLQGRLGRQAGRRRDRPLRPVRQPHRDRRLAGDEPGRRAERRLDRGPASATTSTRRRRSASCSACSSAATRRTRRSRWSTRRSCTWSRRRDAPGPTVPAPRAGGASRRAPRRRRDRRSAGRPDPRHVRDVDRAPVRGPGDRRRRRQPLERLAPRPARRRGRGPGRRARTCPATSRRRRARPWPRRPRTATRRRPERRSRPAVNLESNRRLDVTGRPRTSRRTSCGSSG